MITLDQQTAEEKQVAERTFVREFTHSNETYVYDFNQMTYEQVNAGVATFQLLNERLNKPAATFAQLETSGMLMLKLRAFAFILRRRKADGDLAEWKPSEFEYALRFVRNLPSKYMKELDEIRIDFFTNAAIADVESMLQLKPMLGMLESTNLMQLAAGQKGSETSASQQSNESEDSTSATNLTDGSEKAEQTPSIG